MNTGVWNELSTAAPPKKKHNILLFLKNWSRGRGERNDTRKKNIDKVSLKFSSHIFFFLWASMDKERNLKFSSHFFFSCGHSWNQEGSLKFSWHIFFSCEHPWNKEGCLMRIILLFFYCFTTTYSVVRSWRFSVYSKTWMLWISF